MSIETSKKSNINNISGSRDIKNFWVASLSESIVDFGIYSSRTYLPNYIVAVGGNDKVIGQINSLGYFIWALSQPLGGYLSDKRGRRFALLYFTGVLALAYLAYSIAPTWHFIVVAVLLENISKMYIPALQALLAESLSKRERTRGFLIIDMLSNALSIPAPYIGGLIISKVGGVNGMRYVFLMASMAITSAFITRLFLLRETYTPRDKSDKTTRMRFSLHGITKTLRKGITALRSLGKALLVILLIESITFSMPMGILSPYTIRYATVKGLSEEKWGEVVSIARLAYFITTIGVIPFLSKISAFHCLLIGSAMSSISMFLFPKGYFLISISMLLIGQAIYGAAIFSILSLIATSTIRGRVMGIFDMISMLFGAFGSFISSFIYPYNPSLNFLVAASLFFIGFVCLLLSFKLISKYLS